MLIGIAIEMPFALGEMLLGLEVTLNAVGKIKTDKIQAYFIRDWRTLQMVSYLPLLGDLSFICPLISYSKGLLGLWWAVPESVRWLVGVGRIKEASSIVRFCLFNPISFNHFITGLQRRPMDAMFLSTF